MPRAIYVDQAEDVVEFSGLELLRALQYLVKVFDSDHSTLRAVGLCERKKQVISLVEHDLLDKTENSNGPKTTCETK